jgi:exopolyphosphatase / guanosine-5'-triphosphate,3'-diphosphate pyrophosphatase
MPGTMEPTGPPGTDHVRVAVVDLGTNTTRLLVGEVRDGQVEELERRTEITRLGEAVDATGRLADGAKDRVRRVLGTYRELIDRHGAGRTVAVATSAMRDAEDGDTFRGEILERFDLDARTISGREEARLTFLGATRNLPAGSGPTLVLDIGGGSTEFVVGSAGAAPEFDVSTAAGSVRQTERHLVGDPPSPEHLQALAEEVRRIVESEVPSELRDEVDAGIAVAGTATSLAAISQELDPYDPARVHGFALVRGEAERILAMLAALRLEDRRELPGLHPDRAPTIVAGAVILVEAMRAFDLETMRVSETDLLHGAALDAAGTRDAA